MPISDLYHEGELAVQRHANESEMARMNGGAVDKTIPAGALRFIEQQPMAVIGSSDPDGQRRSPVDQPGRESGRWSACDRVGFTPPASC